MTLAPCPRPFCGVAAAFDDGGEWLPSIRCAGCGHTYHGRHGEDAAALVARWNAPRPLAAESLPAFLRELAGQVGFAESQHLVDAARLIEQQAAALERRQ